MAYVFGDVLICDDAETAKAVTFHQEINMRSVTVSGDVYDPSGTISGGSAPQSSGLLLKVQELNEVEKELQQAKSAYQKLEHEENSTAALRQSWTKAKRELEIKSHEVNLLEQQVGGSNASRVSSTLCNCISTHKGHR